MSLANIEDKMASIRDKSVFMAHAGAAILNDEEHYTAPGIVNGYAMLMDGINEEIADVMKDLDTIKDTLTEQGG